MITMIFDGLHSFTDFGIGVKTVNRPLLPNKRRSDIVIPGRDSSYDFSDNTYENVIIPVELIFAEENFEDLRARARRLSAWLSKTGFKPLIFTDEPDKYYSAKIFDGASLKKILDLVPGESATINFECKPFAIGVVGGSWGNRIVNNAISLDNDGTYFTLPIIMISPVILSGGMDRAVEVTGAFNPESAPSPILTNPAISIGDDTLVYTGTLSGNEILIINTNTYQATKGGANVLNNISGDWPSLKPGSNSIALVDASSECGGVVKISYSRRWL